MDRLLTLPMLVSIIAGCASVTADAESVTAAHQFNSSYATDADHYPQWRTRIDFLGSRLVYSHMDSSPESRAMSDAGRMLNFAETGEASYIEELPFSVPKTGTTDWATDSFQCTARGMDGGKLINCSAAGSDFSSFHSPTRGVEWFEYACGPYTGELCRYRLTSARGLFAGL